MDEEKFARLQDDTQHLIAVGHHASWDVVRRVFRDKQTKELKDFFKNVPMSQSDIDYKRGFGAALEYVIETVDNAEAAFAVLVAKRKEAEQIG